MHISSSKVSYVIPATFEEKILRVYLRKERGADHERYKKAARLAFHNFTRRANLASPESPQSGPVNTNGDDLFSMSFRPSPLTLNSANLPMGGAAANQRHADT